MQSIESMNIIVLNLGHAETVHHWGNKDISSPFIRIYYVKKGRAVLHMAGNDMEITPGHMYLLPGYTPHSYECDPEFEFYYLFIFQRNNNAFKVFDYYEFPIEVKTNTATQLLFENYCELYPQLSLPAMNAEDFDRHPSYYDYAQAYMKMAAYERLQLNGLVEILFSYFLKHSTPKVVATDEPFQKLIDYISSHINEPITVEQLADKACLTKSYLIRAFRKVMGVTPLQYIIRKKIQRAQAMLLSTNAPVHEIASALGFEDTSYFIRIFKKNIGFTPQEYRVKLIG